MNFIILTIVVLYAIALSIALRIRKKEEKDQEKTFWDKEHEANFTRKKSLDDLKYIEIPKDIYSLAENIINDNQAPLKTIQAAHSLLELKGKSIYGLNGISNTDIKLTYGAANLTYLSECDQNYTSLITSLNELAAYYRVDSKEKAVTLLEYAVEIQSDISISYEMLADIYIETGNGPLIHALIKNAESLKAFRGPAIVRMLKKKLDAI